jgi:ATP-dependent RNA helicase RhlE
LVHSFSSLKLSDSILNALTTSGYTTPTPIQAQAIPAALAGRDILGCAQTGTGKTAAFALPIIERLKSSASASHGKGPRLPRALVLAPTRELAVQIAESFVAYGKTSGITGTTIFGGVSQVHQVRALQRGVDVVVATPGRLMDLMQQRHVNLSAIQTLVLDEADRMLDMGFIQPIRQIAAAVPVTRQTLLFSATMPREIVKLAESLLRDPMRVSVAPVASTALKIEQCVHMVGREEKLALLTHWLNRSDVQRSIVFVRTKHGADKLSRKLCQSGLHSEAIHGNRNQNQRQRSLDAFRSGRTPVLVATDVAARGIDVDDVTHVFNFDLPHEPEAYVHRIGRTGRAGATGTAVAFCDSGERSMLKAIEKLIGKQIVRAPQVEVPRMVVQASPVEKPHTPAHEPARAPAPAPAHAHRPAGHPRKHAPSAAAAPGHGGRKQHPLDAARGKHRHGVKSFSGGARTGSHAARSGGRGGARRKLQGARGPR